MRQLEEVNDHGTSITRADGQSRIHGLGLRQSAVLAAIYWAGMASRGELEPRFPQVSRRSLQRDLKLLLEKDLIRETGSAKLTDPNRSYVPAPDRKPRTTHSFRKR
mgnify:FL=1